jgi:hypothetical protein
MEVDDVDSLKNPALSWKPPVSWNICCISPERHNKFCSTPGDGENNAGQRGSCNEASVQKLQTPGPTGQQCLKATAERIGTSEREDMPTISEQSEEATDDRNKLAVRSAEDVEQREMDQLPALDGEGKRGVLWGATIDNRRHPKRQADEAAPWTFKSLIRYLINPLFHFVVNLGIR